MLSRRWSDRKPRYDVLVVGSGYGGAIAAARFAAADVAPRLSVCVLERGREWPVGTFPDTFERILPEFRSPFNPLGLYEQVTGRDITVIKGNGLGGTSLVNANVAIVPAAGIFERGWPAALTRAALLPYYHRAQQVLAATAHPRAASLLKVQALDRRAGQLGESAFPLNIVVNFDVDGPNAHGVVQRPCIDCGDCVTGCNVGAKNTLAMNYLPMAAAAGTEIYTQARVDFVQKRPGGGWQVHGTRFKSAIEREPFQIEAAHVVLAAGAINTTEILLRSEQRGLTVSPRLGSGFGGNGDFFGLAYNGDFQTNVLGFGNRPASPRRNSAPGPTIVAALRYDGAAALEDRFMIQDLSFPSGYVDAARHAFAVLPREDTDSGDEREEARRVARDRNPFTPAPPNGALNHTMLYLCMGIDDAKGSILLETNPFDPHGQPRIVWDDVGRQPIFTRINEELRLHARAQGASFIAQPLWTGFDARHLITAHPLGGCPLGEDYQQGVADEFGRVFAADGEVHEGLFVTDGSLVPTALGVNPLLTICALAERIVERKVQHLQGLAYPAPPRSAGVSMADALEVSGWREPQLERVFSRVRTRPLDTIVNEGGHQVDLARRVIRDDESWKGFFPAGHVLNAMSAALFTGFRKRFTRSPEGSVVGVTSDTDGRITARNTLETITIDRRQGDLDPGEYILLRYVDPPWQGYYDIFRAVNDDLLIGRVYLGIFPHGLRLFTFPMTRLRRFDQMSVDDHRTLYASGAVPETAALHGVWRMDVVSNANHLAGAAHLWFDLKPDGRLESRYQLLGLLEGLIVPSIVEDHFRLDDFTPFHDEIRAVTGDFMVGKWITELPASAATMPAGSLGILHVEEHEGVRRLGFYYTLSRTGAAAFQTGTLLRPFLDVQLPSGVGLTFEEEMVGWYFPGLTGSDDDRETAQLIAERIPPGGDPAGAVGCRFSLRMAIADLNEFIDGGAHEARPAGTIRFDTFEGSAPASFRVDERSSAFHYLRVNAASGEAEMRYHLEFATPDEREFVFEGRKYMEKDSPRTGRRSRHAIADLLEDYTTLYVRVSRRTAAGLEIVGLAYLKFRTFEDLFAVKDLTAFLRSFTVTGTEDPAVQLQAQMRFLAFTAQFVQREYDPLAPAIVDA